MAITHNPPVLDGHQNSYFNHQKEMWKLSKVSANEVQVSLGSDHEVGLTSNEVALRAKIHGDNELPKEEKVKFVAQIDRGGLS